MRCCGCRRFAHDLTAGRPFADDAAVLARADAIEASLSRDEWLEAFAAHPRIGETRGTSAWSRAEQAGVATAGTRVARALAAGNVRYQQRFGHVFLISASGLDAESMLHALERRLGNDAETELEEAAREQRKITRLRLTKLAQAAAAGEDEEP